ALQYSTLSFKTNISFSFGGQSYTVYEFTIDCQFHRSIHTDHGILIPLSYSKAPVFQRLASLAPWIIRRCGHPTCAEQFSMYIGDGLLLSINGIDIHPIQFQHLNLHAHRKPALRVCLGIAPDENPGVASLLQMSPLDMHDKVLIHLLRSH